MKFIYICTKTHWPLIVSVISIVFSFFGLLIYFLMYCRSSDCPEPVVLLHLLNYSLWVFGPYGLTISLCKWQGPLDKASMFYKVTNTLWNLITPVAFIIIGLLFARKFIPEIPFHGTDVYYSVLGVMIFGMVAVYLYIRAEFQIPMKQY